MQAAKAGGFSADTQRANATWKTATALWAARRAAARRPRARAAPRQEGLRSRDIAAAIGEHLGLPAVSVAPDDAAAHFGWIAGFLDITASNARTRELFRWTPTGPTLFEYIAAGAYRPA